MLWTAINYASVDIAMTGHVYKSRDDPIVTKEYFAGKKGKTRRQKACTYIPILMEGFSIR